MSGDVYLIGSRGPFQTSCWHPWRLPNFGAASALQLRSEVAAKGGAQFLLEVYDSYMADPRGARIVSGPSSEVRHRMDHKGTYMVGDRAKLDQLMRELGAEGWAYRAYEKNGQYSKRDSTYETTWTQNFLLVDYRGGCRNNVPRETSVAHSEPKR